jgi:N-acetylmuramoyl-L-alanine amidase
MKTLFLLDPGHGGLFPEGHEKAGQYVTPGKRSPLFEDRQFADGSPFCLYEGVNNRDNVKRLLEEMERFNMDAMDIVNDWRDVRLNERIRRINELARTRNCVLISIHSNGHSYAYIDKEFKTRFDKKLHSPTVKKYYKREFTTGQGLDVFIYNGGVSKNSVRMANFAAQELKCNLTLDPGAVMRWRGLKKRNFAMLRETNCPAILIEGGFHTNKEEAELILTESFKDKFIKSIVDACILYG